MKCPQCSTTVRFNWKETEPLYSSFEIVGDNNYAIAYDTCPHCRKIVVKLLEGQTTNNPFGKGYMVITESEEVIFPKVPYKEVINGEHIPELFYEDYIEAVNTLPTSHKASAALSRRLLQNILRQEYHINKKNLSQEIQEFVLKPGIPTYLTDAVDAIRELGNFAAHPTKDNETGSIVQVEAKEATW